MNADQALEAIRKRLPPHINKLRFEPTYNGLKIFVRGIPRHDTTKMHEDGLHVALPLVKGEDVDSFEEPVKGLMK